MYILYIYIYYSVTIQFLKITHNKSIYKNTEYGYEKVLLASVHIIEPNITIDSRVTKPRPKLYSMKSV